VELTTAIIEALRLGRRVNQPSRLTRSIGSGRSGCLFRWVRRLDQLAFPKNGNGFHQPSRSENFPSLQRP